MASEFVDRSSLLRGVHPDGPIIPEPTWPLFTFVDLFAGIGGFRFALQKAGGKCLFSCERDRFAKDTYESWFKEVPFGDINDLKTADDIHREIPDHDVLTAGFPCQPFSIAGVSKKNALGQAHGFLCEKQGSLFFKLAEIIETKRPAVAFLENVKNLRSHDNGRTWRVISDELQRLRYRVFPKVIDAAGWVPQHRERFYIVCFDIDRFGTEVPFDFPAPPSERPSLSEILDADVPPKYTLTNHLWKYLRDYAKKHQEKGNGFGYGLADLEGVTRTLSARYYKDGSEILIPQSRNPRRLTPTECARLMGFTDPLPPTVVSDTQAYKQFGNAVVPKVVQSIMSEILKVMVGNIVQQQHGQLCPPVKKPQPRRLAV